MTVKFESDKQFEKTLQEVKFLYLAAKSAQVDQSNYKTFNKCALLLLVVKLETYLENVVEDYINTINNLNVKTKSLPNILKFSHSANKLKDLGKSQFDEAMQNKFEEIGILWGNLGSFNRLEVDSRFTLGRHGEKEIQKLFQRVGFNDIYSKIKIYRTVPDPFTPRGFRKEVVDFKGILNSAIAIRHNIIHEDATPSLTHDQIQEYQEYFRQFTKGISKLLGKHLLNIKNKR